MLFERTGISRRPDALVCQELEQLRETDRLTPDLVFRDACVLLAKATWKRPSCAIFRWLDKCEIRVAEYLTALHNAVRRAR